MRDNLSQVYLLFDFAFLKKYLDSIRRKIAVNSFVLHCNTMQLNCINNLNDGDHLSISLSTLL